MENKKEIRKRILSIRNYMSSDDANYKSGIIMNKLAALEEYKHSKTIFVYMSFGNEVNTLEFIKQMLLSNKRVVVSYTDSKNTVLILSEIKSLEDDLERNKFGYLEPVFEKIINVEPEEIDLIIAPGVVFDKSLNRIGYGKGYYDRILSVKREDAKVVAVAYDFQVLDNIPAEEHDVKMDMIVTEESIYK